LSRKGRRCQIQLLWRRAWKPELIERDNPQWRDLYDEIQR